MGKHRSNECNQRLGRKQRCFNSLIIKWLTDGLQHHSDNSYYYFDDQYKGRRYQFIHGIGILELRSDTYVKIFDDPVLGWSNIL